MVRIFSILSLLTLALAGRSAAADAYDTLEANRKHFKENHPYHYTFVYENSCYCRPKSWLVEMAGEKVVQASIHHFVDDTTRPSADLQYFSPDSIFARVKAALDSKPARIDIRYDAALGFPAYVSVDPSARIADEEYGFGMDLFSVVITAARPWGPQALRPAGGPAYDLKGRPAPDRRVAAAIFARPW
jgi:hypothetical protein